MKRHKSAMKQLRKSIKLRQHNRKIKTSLRTAVKKIDAAIALKDATTAKPLLTKTLPALNRAATKGLLHKNTAARLVSRLTKKVTQLPQA
ncbi:MAG: 30S ribosomal protein S20 [bacterium]|nr:30S ribosomal protein S20 [bacterium]